MIEDEYEEDHDMSNNQN